MNQMIPVITIDGPAGAGKGTVCQHLAMRLGGWHILDSGILYRVLAFTALRQQVALSEELLLAQLAANLSLRFEPKSDFSGNQVFLQEEEVSAHLCTEECGQAASQVAAFTQVRTALLTLQRHFRQLPGLVADGRDMGTVVFPDAPCKIFLTATVKKRAERRYKQLNEKGINASIDLLIHEISERDKRDMYRVAAPLKPAEDALIIDTTELSVEEVVGLVAQRAVSLIGITSTSSLSGKVAG